MEYAIPVVGGNRITCPGSQTHNPLVLSQGIGKTAEWDMFALSLTAKLLASEFNREDEP